MIQSVEGELYLRYNGVLLTNSNFYNLFGTECDMEVYSEDFILWEDGILYTDLSFSEIVKSLAYASTDKVEEYDEVLSQGCGFSSYLSEKKYENSFIISKDAVNSIKKVLPLSEFKKNYPKVKIKELVQFYKELEDYYQNLSKD